MNISLQKAAHVFDTNPTLTKWVPVQDFKNAVVKYEKADEFINKVVTRKDGTEITGQFKDGNLVKTVIENIRGKIVKEFNRVNDELPEKFRFEKSTTVTLPNGDSFSRYEDKTNGVMDIWSPNGGIIKTGKMNYLYNEFLSKVKLGEV